MQTHYEMGVAIHLVFSLKSNSPYTGIHIICKTLEMGFCAFLSVYSTIDFCKTLNGLLDKKPKLAPGGYCVCKTRLHLLYNYFPYLHFLVDNLHQWKWKLDWFIMFYHWFWWEFLKGKEKNNLKYKKYFKPQE